MYYANCQSNISSMEILFQFKIVLGKNGVLLKGFVSSNELPGQGILFQVLAYQGFLVSVI